MIRISLGSECPDVLAVANQYVFSDIQGGKPGAGDTPNTTSSQRFRSDEPQEFPPSQMLSTMLLAELGLTESASCLTAAALIDFEVQGYFRSYGSSMPEARKLSAQYRCRPLSTLRSS